MKSVYYIFLILLIGTSACTTKQKRTAQTADSTAAPALAITDAPRPVADRLTRLGLTSDSQWRGLNLGDDFDSVKKTEKGEPFEQDARHVGYAVDFPNLESMDVLYEQQNEKISAITADLYLNNRFAVDECQKALSDHFTNRYGTPKTVNGNSVWHGPVSEHIRLSDVSKGKDYGLKVSITSAGRVTASAK